MERNILLTIEYDGTNFSGWQRQLTDRTVQGEIEKVLSVLCAQDIKINGTSRTDAGVHAFGQRASFSGNFSIPTDRIQFAANNLLDKSVRIKKVEEVPMDFHARFDSKGKTYRYVIENLPYVDPFTRNFAYFVKGDLDLEKMREACKYIVGEHDFKCFQSTGGDERLSTVRIISFLDIEKKGNRLELKITGNGFLYNMVRIIVGTLVDVGRGKIQPEFLEKIIESKNRKLAGHTAPSCGLFLEEIYF